MTRKSSSARAAQLDKPGPAMIARFSAHGNHTDFPVSEADLDTDSMFWREQLSGYGVTRGSRAVVSALSYELPWYQPVRMATSALGGSYSNVETWGWDAKRLDMFCRRLAVNLIVGLTGEMVDGLAMIGSLTEILHGTTVLVRPSAVEALGRAWIRQPNVIVTLGPAVAVSLPDGSGIGYDTTQWTIECDYGELVVSSHASRAARFHRQRTGVYGAVHETPAGPRITLAP